MSEATVLEGVKKIYRQFSMKFHPDRNPGDESAAKKFELINKAYKLLGDSPTNFDVVKALKTMTSAVDSSDELEVVSDLINQVLLHNKLTMSDIDFSAYIDAEEIATSDVDWAAFGVPETRRRCQWIETLSTVVASGHSCRVMVTRGSNRITLVGRQSDREIAEYMIGFLVRLLQSMSQKAYDAYYWEMEKAGTRHLAKGFKDSYLIGFIVRLNTRYQNALNDAKNNEHVSAGTLVKMSTAMARVDKYLAGAKKADGFTRERKFNSRGYREGQEAADKVSLKANAMDGEEIEEHRKLA